MKYSVQKMETDIRQLVTAKHMNDWPVGGGGMMSADADQFFPQLRLADRHRKWRNMNYGPREAQLKKDLLVGELTAFCFKCYQRANTAHGDQVIGRFNDLLRDGIYQKVARMMPANPVFQVPHFQRPTARNLFQRGAQGNALLMDKWATMMNDAWLLGGMHRGANFQLASPRIPDNLWNHGGGYLVVTAREILGLQEFGYELDDTGATPVFRRKNWRSRFISLIDYDRMIGQKGNSFKDAMKLTANHTSHMAVMAQIPRAATLRGVRRAAGRTGTGY